MSSLREETKRRLHAARSSVAQLRLAAEAESEEDAACEGSWAEILKLEEHNVDYYERVEAYLEYVDELGADEET